MKAVEVNFDGLVGPTHHYAGLGYGNLASIRSRHSPSNPRQAALQGLEKMRFLMERGYEQAFVPPQLRPNLRWLRERLGFAGDTGRLLREAHRARPDLLSACFSASSMWTANAATVSPSADTEDSRVHITPANLTYQPHRSLESGFNARFFRWALAAPALFVHHASLDARQGLYDEGAANHCRLAPAHGAPGLELFVHASARQRQENGAFAGRHNRRSSEQIINAHRLPSEQVLLLEQNPEAVSKGVFHNDVIAVSNENMLLYHEQAFSNRHEARKQILSKWRGIAESAAVLREVSSNELTVEEAVRSYLFNSQLLTHPSGGMLLLCPLECRELPRAAEVIASLLSEDNPISEAHHFDLRQSMRNGGGPACLRLRVVLTPEQLLAVRPEIRLSARTYAQLRAWIRAWYRDRLTLEDLADPGFADECACAVQALADTLGLRELYADALRLV